MYVLPSALRSRALTEEEICFAATCAGFVKGVGRGLVGAVAAPVSGGLDLFSSAIEGLDASKERLLGRPRAGTLLARRRLPRAIGGDAKLQPFLRDGSEAAVRCCC